MSVLLEFTIPARAFHLGDVLSGGSGMHLELERIVPTGNMVMPFIWATGSGHAGFERKVRDHPSVKELVVLDTIGDRGLYRIEWADGPHNLIEGVSEADTVVMQASGNGDWTFRLRFSDHERLSQFHNYVIDHDIPIHIERTYTLSETTERGHRFNLTVEQREALILALRRGYFETPSAASLDELADELEISRQALSSRIRGGNEKILQEVLLSSADTFS
jgi:predicted DNA binding protein